MPSHRIPVLAAKIVEHIQLSALRPGTRLTERALAAQFDMSRAPVRVAMQELASNGVLQSHPGGGFMVGEASSRPDQATKRPAEEEERYLTLAQDHLAAQVPARITENALMRRYSLSRHEVSRLLQRAAREGWAERLPGHGWRLLPMLASAGAYAQAYRFRIVIEPSGLLDPDFRADRPALLACKAQQLALLKTDPADLSTARMFDTANAFHEVVIRCSNNPFLIDGLGRLSRLRRLIEYGKSIHRQPWLARCAQHVAMLDLILEGRQHDAAESMRQHLEEGAASKSENT